MQEKEIAPVPSADLFAGLFNPVPGVHPELPNKTYHASPGLSRSGIQLLLKSPIYYWSKYINLQEEEKKDHFFFGSALHTLVLEPELFNREYVVIPKIDRRTKEGKRQYEAASLNSLGKTIMTKDDFDKICLLKSQISANNEALELLLHTLKEQSLYWIDQETGILCKARPDFMFLGDSITYVGDIKTTTNASPRSFARDMYEYGYHIQAAMIQEGLLRLMGILIEDFYAVVVEKEEPYVTAIYKISQESIEVGKRKFREGLHIYKECSQKNSWPGYPMQEVGLPAYAFYE